MSKKKTTNHGFDFAESHEDFRLKSLTGRVNNELLGLYATWWRRFGDSLLKDGGIGGMKTAMPVFLAADEYRHRLSLFNVWLVDGSGAYSGYGLNIQDPTPLSLMQYYSEQGWSSQNQFFYDFKERFEKLIKFELADSVYIQTNVLAKLNRRFTDDYLPVHNYMKSKGSNLILSELQILEPDAVIVLGQNTTCDAILLDTLGSYTVVSVSEDLRIRRLIVEGSDLPVVQTPNAMFLELMKTTDSVLAYLKEFIIDQMRIRMSGFDS